MGCGISSFRPAGGDHGADYGFLGRNKRKVIDGTTQRSYPEIANNNTYTSSSTKLILKETLLTDPSNGRKSVSSPMRDALAATAKDSNQTLYPRREYMTPETVHHGYGATNKLDIGGEILDRGVEAKGSKYSKDDQAEINDHATKEEEEEDYDEGARISDVDGPLWIASPSFREYCFVNHDSQSQDSVKGGTDDDGNNDGQKSQNMIPRSNLKLSDVVLDTPLRHESSSPSVKKTRMKLKNMLTRHRTTGVKNLFQVSTRSSASSGPNAPGKSV